MRISINERQSCRWLETVKCPATAAPGHNAESQDVSSTHGKYTEKLTNKPKNEKTVYTTRGVILAGMGSGPLQFLRGGVPTTHFIMQKLLKF